ncbi:MAG: hypothetical protein AAF184_11145 [Pseudomonadota bacterium]
MLPWHSYPYQGAAGAEGGGGAEDLQTDVMRFMAMLGLCLVAIFALVQSLPATPTASEAPAEPVTVAQAPVVAGPTRAPEPSVPAPPVKEMQAPEPTPTPPAPPVVARPTPAPAKVAPLAPVVEPAPPPERIERKVEAPVAPLPARVVRALPPPPQEPPPMRAERAPVPIPTPTVVEEVVPPPKPLDASPPPRPVTPSPPPDRTPVFTLRFVDAQALLALVQRDVVSLFAVDGQGTSRLSSAAGRYAFDTAPAPSQMHDMDPASVPAQVRAAYTRSRGRSAGTVRRWGVVLPASTRRSIDQLLRDPRGGELQIAADGQVRLVPTLAAQPVAAYLMKPLARRAS